MSASSPSGLTLAQVAARAGVAPGTVRRWVKEGLVPQYDGTWTPAAASHVRIVARLRERGHSVQRIREASQSGKLAFGYVNELLPSTEGRYSTREAARETDLEPALVERLMAAMGLNVIPTESISEGDLQVLRYGSEILAAGLPAPALLQIVRVYAQAMAQVADAEVRLFHLYSARAADARRRARRRGGAGDGGDDARDAARSRRRSSTTCIHGCWGTSSSRT